MNSRTRQLYGEFSELGIEVLGSTQCRRSAHLKIRCRYRGHGFIYVTSTNIQEAGQGMENMRGDLKRIQRAIRTGNNDVLKKYKVRRDDT